MCQCSSATEQLWVLSNTLLLHVNFYPSDQLFFTEGYKYLICLNIAKRFTKKVRSSSMFKEKVRNFGISRLSSLQTPINFSFTDGQNIKPFMINFKYGFGLHLHETKPVRHICKQCLRI